MDGRINAKLGSPVRGKILACESSLASVAGAGLGGYSWEFQFYLRAIWRSISYGESRWEGTSYYSLLSGQS